VSEQHIGTVASPLDAVSLTPPSAP
jgi:hypothetical protein